MLASVIMINALVHDLGYGSRHLANVCMSS